jgi:DNA-binding transcriptional LysR family regulator
MHGGNLNDLLAFLAVGQERSFTKAAAKLGVSQSALSHTIRGLEERLGLRLLTRTTRSVSPTEAGERLLHSIGPRFEEIQAELDALSEFREKPAGTIRITATDYAADTILWPRLTKFLRQYPHIKVEIVILRGDGQGQPPLSAPGGMRAAPTMPYSPVPEEKDRFALDSLLEGRVHCELVSEIRRRFR